MRKILFGGGFDPIHLGHIHIAEKAHQQLGGDVIFLPTPISVWKNESRLSKIKSEWLSYPSKENHISVSIYLKWNPKKRQIIQLIPSVISRRNIQTLKYTI